MSDLRELVRNLEMVRRDEVNHGVHVVSQALAVLRRVICRNCGEIRSDHLTNIDHDGSIVRDCPGRNGLRTFTPMEES